MRRSSTRRAPVADHHSRWDELTGLHRMIQSAFSPLGRGINFGHGGFGSYSFLSWHHYFLLNLERLLQGKVPGVMIPYWDWTNPASLLTDTFLGPNGDLTGVIRRDTSPLKPHDFGLNPSEPTALTT